MLDSVRYYGGGLFRHLRDKEVFLWAQAVAFKVLVTLVPIVVLATGVVGQVLRRERPFASVENLIRDFMPASAEDALVDLLSQLQIAGSSFTLIGVVGLLLTATTLFTTIRLVLAGVFREEWHEHRTILGGYAFDLRMAVQVGTFFIASVGLTLLLQAGGPAAYTALREFGYDFPSLLRGWSRFLKGFGVIFPYLLSVGMFFQFLLFTPKPRPPRRSALWGAMVGATLWELGKWGFAYYARTLGNLPDSWIGALGDTFGLIIALVLWAYFSGVVLIIGALITLLHETRRRTTIRVPIDGEPSPYAALDAPESHE